jgi:hypothetical protein
LYRDRPLNAFSFGILALFVWRFAAPQSGPRLLTHFAGSFRRVASSALSDFTIAPAKFTGFVPAGNPH